jgi:hypothetical protein
MSDFVADLQSYFASEQRAREAELADARPAFEPAEYAGRLDRLRRAMSEAGVDVVLLGRPESMCWLHGYTARWYRHGGPPEWPALTTSVVRADRDEVIHFDFGGEEELLSATSVCGDVRIYPSEAVDGALAFLVRELTSAGWLAGRIGRERRGLPPDQRTGEAIEAAIVAAGGTIEDATALIDRLLHLTGPGASSSSSHGGTPWQIPDRRTPQLPSPAERRTAGGLIPPPVWRKGILDYSERAVVRASWNSVTAELVRRKLTADAGSDFCRECCLVSGGNPFLLGTLLDELAAERIAPTSANASRLAGVRPTTT